MINMPIIHHLGRPSDVAALRRFYRKRRVPFWVQATTVVLAIAAAELVVACWLVSRIQ